MIKVFTAYTAEVDEVEDALDEILDQIDLGSLKKNSVGVLSCYSEFISEGIVSALCDKLPFDVIGTTTMAGATGNGSGMYGLSLAVLTSDDVTFSSALSESLTADGSLQSLSDTYGKARKELPGDPSLIFAFFPLVSDLSGAILLDQLDKLCGGAPVFGTLSSDVVLTQENCRTVLNKDSDRRAAAFLLMHGDVNAKFIVSSLPDRNVSKQKAVVTAAEGCILKKVNGVPLQEYLQENGMLTRSATGLSAVNLPLMVDYGNGSKAVAVRVYNVFENGDALCGGFIPVDACISIGQVDHDGIIGTTEEALSQIAQAGEASGFLMYSCVSRYLTLTPNKDEEIKKVSDTIGGRLAYELTYSGGEICPVYAEDGKTYNRMHNYTCVACVFRS